MNLFVSDILSLFFAAVMLALILLSLFIRVSGIEDTCKYNIKVFDNFDLWRQLISETLTVYLVWKDTRKVYCEGMRSAPQSDVWVMRGAALMIHDDFRESPKLLAEASKRDIDFDHLKRILQPYLVLMSAGTPEEDWIGGSVSPELAETLANYFADLATPPEDLYLLWDTNEALIEFSENQFTIRQAFQIKRFRERLPTFSEHPTYTNAGLPPSWQDLLAKIIELQRELDRKTYLMNFLMHGAVVADEESLEEDG